MYPRVTEILKLANLIEPYGPWVTQWHIDRGTIIHQATVLDDEGDLDDTSLDDEVLRRVNLYRAWRDEYQPEMIARERFASHKHLGYCGTYDILCKIEGELSLVDIKQWPEKWHGIQLSAYEALTGEPCKRYSLYIGGKKYRFVERDDETDWEVFRSAVVVAKWKLRNSAATEPEAGGGDERGVVRAGESRHAPGDEAGADLGGES